jgi:predicted alpha/beta hydrolase family esterase
MNSDKRAAWQQHISDWSNSSLSQKRYCEQNDLKLANFSYWRKRLSAQTASTKFVPVTVVHPSSVQARLSVAGVQIEVPIHALADVLPLVLQTIRASA